MVADVSVTTVTTKMSTETAFSATLPAELVPTDQLLVVFLAETVLPSKQMVDVPAQ